MNKYMNIALKEADKSLKTNDIPVGAVIVENDKIIAKAHNTRQKTHNILAHAEIIAIQIAAKKKKTWHLNECEIYTTLKPCNMCLEVIKQTKIKKIYYAAESSTSPQEKLIMRKIDDNNQSVEKIKEFFTQLRK